MKPKNLFMTVCIVCAVCVAGCDDDRSSEHPGTPLPTGPYHFLIEENHDVECCGIKDPLANLEWLQVDTAHDQYLRYWCVYLALDTITNEDIIVCAYGDYHWYEYAHYYLCNGEHLFGGECYNAYWYYYLPHTKVCRNVSFMPAAPREDICNDTTGRESHFQYKATIYCRKTIWEKK
ncbi:MAG: hypothetical protein MSS84_02145 [Bacteroidales bacterium]|nr:hypothetical protein [Bacteroidales bacterium]